MIAVYFSLEAKSMLVLFFKKKLAVMLCRCDVTVCGRKEKGTAAAFISACDALFHTTSG